MSGMVTVIVSDITSSVVLLLFLDGYLNMRIQVYYDTIHSYYIYILF